MDGRGSKNVEGLIKDLKSFYRICKYSRRGASSNLYSDNCKCSCTKEDYMDGEVERV